ncbi:hypothetical protein HMI56_004402, partial [Coelomomyces lativittatus]
QTRELQDSDYSTLLELDQSTEQQGHERLVVVNIFPIYRLQRLSSPPLHCLICLDVFSLKSTIRSLPCHHAQFHQECIDRWLLQSSTKCPKCSYSIIITLDSGKYLPAPSNPCSPNSIDPILNLCEKKSFRASPRLPPPISSSHGFRSGFFRKKTPLPSISTSSTSSLELHVTEEIQYFKNTYVVSISIKKLELELIHSY